LDFSQRIAINLSSHVEDTMMSVAHRLSAQTPARLGNLPIFSPILSCFRLIYWSLTL